MFYEKKGTLVSVRQAWARSARYCTTYTHSKQRTPTDQKQSRGSCGDHVPLTGKHDEKQDYELASTPFPLRSPPPPRLSPFLYQLPSLDKLVFVHVRKFRWHELEVLQDLRPFLGPVLDTLEPPE